jgi:hypothetical protein
LVAADPGAQIESVRPVARVVRSDAVRQFASSLIQARPVWRADFIHQLSERILDPTPPAELPVLTPSTVSPASHTGAEAENAFANELGFAFEEGEQQPPAAEPPVDGAASLPQAAPPKPAAKKKFMGLQDTQIILLVGMFLVELCILFGFAILFYLGL